MSFRDDEDRRLWEELASMDAADTSKPVPLLEEMDGPLTDQQIAFFKHEGYCLLEGFLDPLTVLRWNAAFRDHIAKTVPGFDLADDATWPDGEGFAAAQAGWSFPVGSHPKFAAVVNQLGGGHLVENRHTSNNATRWPAAGDEPNDPSAWTAPGAGHIDGYGPGGWSGGWDTLYKDPEWSGGLGMADEPMEVVGPAGTVCLWHNFLCHDGSPNLIRNQPRVAIISRFHMDDMFRGPQMMPPGQDGRVEPPNFEPIGSQTRTDERRYETPTDLFERWSDETRRVKVAEQGEQAAAKL